MSQIVEGRNREFLEVALKTNINKKSQNISLAAHAAKPTLQIQRAARQQAVSLAVVKINTGCCMNVKIHTKIKILELIKINYKYTKLKL